MTLTITGRTDRQTDGQTDRVRRNMRPPPREEGRIKIKVAMLADDYINGLCGPFFGELVTK